SLIIHSMETGQPRTIYGNVPNSAPSLTLPRGEKHAAGEGVRLLIENLPAECCVEVPCVVNAEGLRPQAVGALPPQLAALMQTNINVQALTVEAALTHKR